VRFELGALAAAFPYCVGLETGRAEVASVAPSRTSTSKTRVGDTSAASWFAFYKATWPPEWETEDDVAAHFAMNFPKHTLSRERLRGLRGKGKQGPKPRVAD
jgi:hypothetical protein